MDGATMYGIPNCDTVKKARLWLGANGIAFAFHDYRKQGVPEARLRATVTRSPSTALAVGEPPAPGP